MSAWSFLRTLLGGGEDTPTSPSGPVPTTRTSTSGTSGEGHAPLTRDTLAAIDELSRAVETTPDALEIYLALGTLYRAQGDTERAVALRQKLVERPSLDDATRARALLELGRDFRRAGLVGRARTALERAARLRPDDAETLFEMASLHADVGDPVEAANLYGRIGHPLAQAHYLVVHAEDVLAAGDAGRAREVLQQALGIFPGSVEAWMLVVRMSEADTPQAPYTPKTLDENLRHAFTWVAPGLKFLIVHDLLNRLDRMARTVDNPDDVRSRAQTIAKVLLPIIDEGRPDVLLLYHGALLLQRCGDEPGARQWLERTLLTNAEFWPARLDLLAASMDECSELPGMLTTQLDFFVRRARRVKQFMCSVCGLKMHEPFFVCPRCRSWHSITFRMRLTE